MNAAADDPREGRLQFSVSSCLGATGLAAIYAGAVFAPPTWVTGLLILSTSTCIPAVFFTMVARGSGSMKVFCQGALFPMSVMLALIAIEVVYVIGGEDLSHLSRVLEQSVRGDSEMVIHESPDIFVCAQILACHLKFPFAVFFLLAPVAGGLCVAIERITGRTRRVPAVEKEICANISEEGKKGHSTF